MKTIICVLFSAMGAFATEATLHLRYGAAAKVSVTAATNATPIEITTASAHGFSVGDVVWVWGISGNTNANGTRRVKALISSTKFTMAYCGDRDCTVNGADASGNGVYKAATRIGSWVGATAPYTLSAHPRLWTPGQDARIKDPDGAGSSVAPKAVAGNAPWDAITSWLDSNAIQSNYAWNGSKFNLFRSGSFSAVLAMALRWYSDNSQTTALDGAKHWIENAERISETLACDETVQSCGDTTDMDYAAGYFTLPIGQTYSLIHDQLSPTDITRFTGMMLNDRTDGATCTDMYSVGTGSVIASTTAGILTGSGTDWLTSLAPGDSILVPGKNPRVVVSVDSDTQIHYRTINLPGIAYTGSFSYKIAHPWQTGNCGWAFFGKHAGYSTLSPYLAYPVGGGQNLADLFGNQFLTKTAAFLNIGLATADDDARGARLAENAANWFHDFGFPLYQKYWTGPTQIDSQYGPGRFGTFMNEIVFNLKNATGGAVDYTVGRWLKDRAMWNIYEWLPTSGASTWREAIAWGKSNLAARTHADTTDPAWFSNLFSGADEGKYVNYFMRNVRGDYTSTYLKSVSCLTCPVHYVFDDPDFTATDYRSTINTARAFIYTDVMDTSPSTGTDFIISRTGFSSPDDTLMYITAVDVERTTNHLSDSLGKFNPASYAIYKHNYLLAEDKGTSGASHTGLGYTNWEQFSMYMEVGGTANFLKSTGTTVISDVDVPRYADGGTGPHASKYMYSLVDSIGAYTSAASLSRLHRHFVDFKGGSQQFIVVYDDVASSSGKMKRTFLHYPNNGQAGEGATTYDQATNSVSSLDTTGGAKLLTKVLFPGAAGFTYTDNADGSYTGGVGQTFRVSVCAGSGTTAAGCDTSNTQAEFLTVHMPTMNQAATMPTITDMGAFDANFRGVRIGGSSPKVAIFAKTGNLRTEVGAFTSAATEATQFLVAGLAAGTYNVFQDAVQIATVTVASGDNTLYWEASGGGTFAVTQGAGVTLSILTEGLADGVTGEAYSVALSATGGTPPYTWSVASGTLPTGITLSSGGTLSGTPTVAGSYSFTVQVSDSLAATDTQALTVQVIAPPQTAAPVITTTTLPAARLRTAYSETLAALSGLRPLTWSVASGSLPTGMSLSSTGDLSGTPTQAGTATFQVQACDTSAQCTLQPLVLEVLVTPLRHRVSGESKIRGNGALR